MPLKHRMIYSLILCAAVFCAGCTAILEGETRFEALHVAVTGERQPEERIEVSGYDDLKAVILGYVIEHETIGMMVVHGYDGGDVQADVERAIYEITRYDPRAVYAVADIDGTVTRIVSYFEIDVSIEYKRTKEQMDSIVAVLTPRSLRAELLSIMSEYREEAVFLMTLQVSEDDMAGFIKETYYQNPRSIAMLPVTVMTTFTTGGNERVIELRFRNTDREADVLRQYGASLAGSIRLNARLAEGENDAEILLSLVENIIGACSYDEASARTINEHGVQNLSATAYHALVIGSAVGEGFAMAFKALCDELDLRCIVVLGYLKGMVHAWNIVSLNGENYHVDVAMCAQNGVETAFFKTDAEFMGSYAWDLINTAECKGTLTYEEIAGKEEESEEDEEDEENEENEEDEEAEAGEGGDDGFEDDREVNGDSGELGDGGENTDNEDESDGGEDSGDESDGLENEIDPDEDPALTQNS